MQSILRAGSWGAGKSQLLSNVANRRQTFNTFYVYCLALLMVTKPMWLPDLHGSRNIYLKSILISPSLKLCIKREEKWHKPLEVPSAVSILQCHPCQTAEGASKTRQVYPDPSGPHQLQREQEKPGAYFSTPRFPFLIVQLLPSNNSKDVQIRTDKRFSVCTRV